MFVVLRQHLLKRAAAVGRSIDAALVVRTVGMAEHGDEQPIGVARVDDDVGNLLAVAEAEMRPRLAGVGRLVDAVADRQIGAGEPFAAADVDDVRVRRRDRDRADRSGGLVVEDRRPRPPEVGRLPHPAVYRAGIEDVRLRRHAGDGFGPSAAERSDRTPAHFAKRARVGAAVRGGLRQRRRPSTQTDSDGDAGETESGSWFLQHDDPHSNDRPHPTIADSQSDGRPRWRSLLVSAAVPTPSSGRAPPTSVRAGPRPCRAPSRARSGDRPSTAR